jgi:tRNA (guanine-N7-)-methyltransferase
MGHKKLIRFAAIKTFPNVQEHPKEMQGKWQEYFAQLGAPADNSLVLELACGKGEYTIGLARLFPDKNFAGMDIKGNRMYIGARKALDEKLPNAAFIRSGIDQITDYFTANEVSEIWITFPDPQLRRSKHKKRLTHPKFLRLYQQIMQARGKVNLKTDSPVLYRFTKQVIAAYNLQLLKDYDDVYKQATEPELLNIKTHYEGLNISGSGVIHYLLFELPTTPLPNNDEALKDWVFENEAGAETYLSIEKEN